MTAIARYTKNAPFHIRRSLSRGFAIEAFNQAEIDDGDMAELLVMSIKMTKNLANRRRVAHRMKRLPGVISVKRFSDGLSAILRTRREMILNDTEGEHFREQILMYTFVTFERTKKGMDFGMKRVSFSRHALERLVQRSDCALYDLLGQVDQEAISILHAKWPDTDEERSYQKATPDGVWAGHYDRSLAGDQWPLRYRTEEDRLIPTFSARTFLSVEEMNPVAWLNWQSDDTLKMAS